MGSHPALGLAPFHVYNSSLFPRINPEDTEKLIEDFRQGKGLLTSLLGGPQCFKCSSRVESGWPNLWIAMVPDIRTEDVLQSVSLFSVLGRPLSRGFISLNATLYKAGVRDDVQLALLDLGLLRHPDDVEDMLEGI